MNHYLVTTNDRDRLKKHGKITYESKYSNVCCLETNKSLERVKIIGGVISAEEARTGHFGIRDCEVK